MEYTLEKWQAGYLDDFMEGTDDPHLSDAMCEFFPYPVDTAYAGEYIRERMFNSEEKQMCRAIMVNGKVIGGIDIILGEGVYSKNAELSIWISKGYRGKGIGSAVMNDCCRICFERYDIVRVEGHPFSVNKEAAAALERAGFIHEGTIHSGIFKNGYVHDYEVFAKLKEKAD